MQKETEEFIEKYAKQRQITIEEAQKHKIVHLYDEWCKEFNIGKIKNK